MVVVALLAGMLGGVIVSNRSADDGNAITFTLSAKIDGFEGISVEGNEEGTYEDFEGKVNPNLEVDPRDTVKIVIVSGDEYSHDIKIDEYYVQSELVSSEDSDLEEESSIEFVADIQGEFSYYCTVPGHTKMMGKVIVGEVEKPGPALDVDVSNIMVDWDVTGTGVGSRTTPITHHIWLNTTEVVAELASPPYAPTTFVYWTYNNTVPGPLLRVMLGDNVTIHLYNPAESTQQHSLDLHAVTGPGGGAGILRSEPGETTTFTFEAIHEGTFVYHCASEHIPSHISKGMYGAIVVEPVGGLPTVDVEIYLGQNEIYAHYSQADMNAYGGGHNTFDGAAVQHEDPTYVVFNGKYNGLAVDTINLTEGMSARIFFTVGGPNIASNFHLIGEVWDRVYYETNANPMLDAETVIVAPGSALMIEMDFELRGMYILVDHALSRTFDKGCLGIIFVNP